MQTIKAYLYPNTIEVQFLDPSIYEVRNRQVYSRTITVYQGIDNPVQVICKNQDQKSVNLTNYTVQVDIQDYTNNVTIWSSNVDFTTGNIARGQGMVTIPSTILANLEQRLYSLTTRTISNIGSQSPVYIDDNYGVPLDLQVLPGYLNP